MKKIFAFLAAFAALTSCSVKELEGPESPEDFPVLQASFEGMEGAKTYVDGSLHLFWTADDRLSVFLCTTYNQQYRFTGETGDNAGDFEDVPASGLHSGSDINAIYAVYPYQSTAKLSYDGKITVDLPAVQQYVPGSFGLGANTMVAVTAGKSDTFLSFKNLCGYLIVKLYGNETIKSVTIEGNNGEKLAGKATVTASHNATPTLALADDATTSITIDCGEGVTLGSTAETATEFWFCIPSVTFSNGFKISATGSGRSFSKSTTGSRTIERNVRVSMSALEFVPQGPAVPEMVDLGLPSGIKWASFNLGATKPEEYGGYYQWAGLQDVTDTNISSYCPYQTSISDLSYWTKYVPSNMFLFWSGAGSPDNKTVLDLEDDVTYVKLGDKWRMPTYEEWGELSDNCTWIWESFNDVNGYKITSNKPGFTDKWIFLPATGFRSGYKFYFVGSVGRYWSASLDTNGAEGASDLRFDSYGMGASCDGRYFGQSVRPVYGERVRVTGMSLSTNSLSLLLGQSYTLTATITPANAPEKGVIWTISDSSVALLDVDGYVTAVNPGTATITAKTVDGGYLAQCSVTVKQIPVPEAVDLGLPSGLKWASCNIGASKPEEYGGYYQWAGLEDVSSTRWSDCPYHTGSSASTGWTKYITSSYTSYWNGPGSPDNKIILDPEDDVAHVRLGSKWRMPTNAEFKEMLSNCTSEWTVLNGVTGRRFISKTNGNSIFLPAAGHHVNDYTDFVGSEGYYWSASLVSEYYPNNAYYRYFDSSSVGTGTYDRDFGQSVRPVSE